MQDEINEKVVALSIRAGSKTASLTASMLKDAMRQYLQEQEKTKTQKAVRDYIEVDADEFIKTVEETVNAQQTMDIKQNKKRVVEIDDRLDELEKLLCRIYEDNALGKLPDKRYEFLSRQYETEVKTIEQEKRDLLEMLNHCVDGSTGARKFMELIRKYQDFDTLTNAMANEFIDKIVVFNRDRKGSIQSTQRVDIYFSFIGNFVPPQEPVDPEVQAALDAERARIEAIKDKRHQAYLKRKENGKQKEYDERYKARRQEIKAQKLELFSGYTTDTASSAYELNFASSHDFAEWLREISARSDFTPSHMTLSTDDHIVTLSTCAYDFEDARYVVHGRLSY